MKSFKLFFKFEKQKGNEKKVINEIYILPECLYPEIARIISKIIEAFGNYGFFVTNVNVERNYK